MLCVDRLIHWSLFVFFNHPDGKDEIVDFLLKTRYQEAIQVCRFSFESKQNKTTRKQNKKTITKTKQQRVLLFFAMHVFL